jgi:hypothetical protein
VIDAHLKKKHHPQFRDVPAIELLTHETIEGAFYAVLCLGTQFWLEEIDSRIFTESWENANAQTLTDPWAGAADRAGAARKRATASGGRERVVTTEFIRVWAFGRTCPCSSTYYP